VSHGAADHTDTCGFVAKKDEVPCTCTTKIVHDKDCKFVEGVECSKNCLEAKKVLNRRYYIPVSFKPEKGSAKAPNSTRFIYGYTINTDGNYARSSSMSGGLNWYYNDSLYYNSGRNNSFRGYNRAPGSYYDRGYIVRNGVASGNIDVSAFVNENVAKGNRNFVATVSRVAIKGYTINPAYTLQHIRDTRRLHVQEG